MDVGEIKVFVQEELSTFRKRINLEFLVFEKEMIERLEKLARRQLNIGQVGDGRTVGDRTTDVFSKEECAGMVEHDVDTAITVSGVNDMDVNDMDYNGDLDLDLDLDMIPKQEDAVDELDDVAGVNVVGELKSLRDESSNHVPLKRSLAAPIIKTRAVTPDLIVEKDKDADIEGRFMEVTPIKKELILERISCKDDKGFTMASSMACHALVRRSNMNELLQCQTIGCSYQTDTVPKLRSYIRNKHTKEELFQCHYCPKKFRNRDATNKHVRKHWDTAWELCEECLEFYQIGKQQKCKHCRSASVKSADI